jgi:UDP-glucose 4-epimerase
MYTFHEIDLTDKSAVYSVFKEHDIDIVVHLAGKKAVTESIVNPLTYYHTNIIISCNVFLAALRYNVDTIIFGSSATVYGIPQYNPINEDHITGKNISSPYGKTKYIIEEMLRDLVSSNDMLRVIVLRYFNPCGAHPSLIIGESPKGNPYNLFPVIAQHALERRPVSVFGTDFFTRDGTPVRDYIHIHDLARGHVAAVEYACSMRHGFTSFNLGTGEGYSVKEIIDMYESTNDLKIEIENKPRRNGDVDELICDITKARYELGWEPRKSLKDMCYDSWRYANNSDNGFSYLI